MAGVDLPTIQRMGGWASLRGRAVCDCLDGAHGTGDEEAGVMRHLHLLWIIPVYVLGTGFVTSWLYGIDAEGLVIRSVYMAGGLLLGWLVRDQYEAVRRLA